MTWTILKKKFVNINKRDDKSVIGIYKLVNTNIVSSYEVIDADKFVDANNHIEVYFIDMDNLTKFVDINKIDNKSVIDVDKLIFANKL